MADVERDHARRAALQQHVGEAAGRGADVERLTRPSTSMREGVERMRELEPAAADVRMIRLQRASRSLSAATAVPALDDDLPSTWTWPARISARARSRDPARPRSTTSESRRTRCFTSLRVNDPLARSPGSCASRVRAASAPRARESRARLPASARDAVEAVERG